jgi:hypothetical protein
MIPRTRGVTAAVRGALVVGAVSLALTCHRVSPVTDDSGAAALMRNLVRARAVDVLVEPGPLEEACQRLALVCSPRAPDAPDAGTDAPLGRDRMDYRVNPPMGRERSFAARIVVGTLALPRVGVLLDHLAVLHGARAGGEGFRFQEQYFADEGDVLIATFEDPERPGLPVTLFSGNSVEAIAASLGDLAPAWRPWIQCYRKGELALSGPLQLNGSILTHALGRGIARTGALPQGNVALPVPSDAPWLTGSAAVDVSEERVREYVARAAAARASIGTFIAASELPNVEVNLHAYPEQMVPRVGHARLGAVNPITRAVHVLCASGVPDDGGAAVAEACALAALGEPVHPWLLTGASVDAADRYFGVELDRWIAWLTTSGRLGDRAADPTEPDWSADRSPHLRVPLQAALFRFLRETRGDEAVRQIWHGTRGLVVDAALREQFQQFLARVAAPFAKEFEARRSVPVPRRATNAFAKGVALEASNARLFAGYGSKTFESAVDALPPLGVNTLSITSYLVDEPDPPEFAGFRNRRTFGPVEGDLGLFCALWQARARGLATWLDPHWLSAPAGSYRGSWVREREDTIAEFARRYAAFVEHYGLLAELCGVEVLSIGSDIHETAIVVSEGRRSIPAAVEWKRAAWSHVMRAARDVYGGRLTYVTSSLEELPKIEFWPLLDAIAFTPDTSLDPRHAGGAFSASAVLSERLTKELADLDAVCRANDRPLYLMNVAFEQEERRERRTLAGLGTTQIDEPLHESHVFFTVLGGGARPDRLEGVVLWRWGSLPDDRADEFVFRGGSVESVVRRAFTRF